MCKVIAHQLGICMNRLVFVLVINLLWVSLSFGQSSPLSVNAQFGKIQTLQPQRAWISPKVADYLEIQLSTKPTPINEARNLYTKGTLYWGHWNNGNTWDDPQIVDCSVGCNLYNESRHLIGIRLHLQRQYHRNSQKHPRILISYFIGSSLHMIQSVYVKGDNNPFVTRITVLPAEYRETQMQWEHGIEVGIRILEKLGVSISGQFMNQKILPLSGSRGAYKFGFIYGI